MFKDAKVGDKVWDIRRGWGKVVSNEWSDPYHILVEFNNFRSATFNIEGKQLVEDTNPTLYWDEFRIIPPKKPLPDLDIDTKVLVWDDEDDTKTRAHFHSFNEEGYIVTYSNGRSSYTGTDKVKSPWDNWELYKEK